MWQLSEAIDGMSEACRGLRHPGHRRQRQPLQRVAGRRHRPHAGRRHARHGRPARPPAARVSAWSRAAASLLVGVTQPELSGSPWARDRGHRGGTLPALDVAMHRKVADVVRTLVTGGLLGGVHDVGNGGLGVALAEMAVAVGRRLQRRPRRRRTPSCSPSRPSRVVLCVAPDLLTTVENVLDRGRRARQPHRRRRRRPARGQGPARPAAGRGRRLLATTASPRPSAPARLRTRCPPESQGPWRRAGTMAP